MMWVLEQEDHKQLAEVLREESLTALFQPVIDLADGTLHGYEGLIRGPSNGMLHSPEVLLRVATECGQRVELERLCHRVQGASFQRQGLPGKLFLNISPDVLVQQSLEAGSRALPLISDGADAARVVLELTEGERFLGYGAQDLRNAVARCRDEGIAVAIDDLGEGFSSLRLWSELRPAYVKIDRHFVQNIDHDPVKAQFIRSIVEIARQTHCRVVAEGIETAAELLMIRSLGVDLGQGYYFARPHATPLTHLPQEVRAFLSVPNGHDVHPQWGRDTLGGRQIVRSQVCLSPDLSNEAALGCFENNPGAEVLPVVDDSGIPLGLLSRAELVGHFVQPYRRELYGRKSCVQFMDRSPLIVDCKTSIQNISQLLGSAERRHFLQGFIVTDNGHYSGLAHGQDVIRVITDMQIQAAKYANPLTQLPGNVPIHEHLDGLLRSQAPFTAGYFDLDHFKPYNDVYGFSAGDEVIQLTARLLAQGCDHERDFLGHIGGDDFIVLFCSPDWEARCQRILAAFAAAIQERFNQEDRDRGGYLTENRRFEKEFHPLISLSIGAVTVPPGLFTSYMEVSKMAAGAKKKAKQIAGNALFVNRRYELEQNPL